MSDPIYNPRPPGNYLQDYNDHFRRGPKRFPDASVDALAELAVHGVVAAERASCWIINQTARDFIMNTTLPDDALTDWQLPYPRMCLEWQGTWDGNLETSSISGLMSAPAYERLIMLTDASELDIAVAGDDNYNFQGFSCTSFFKQSPAQEDAEFLNGMEWTINPVSLLIPYEAFDNLHDWMGKSSDGKLNLSTQPIDLHQQKLSLTRPTPICSLLSGRDRWPELVTGGFIKAAIRDMVEEVHMALGLLSMLRCDNVPVRSIQASNFKQRRRRQQYKSRIPTYRTLHLSDHTLQGYNGGKANPGEKAPHWRRGHIRNQPTAVGPIRKWIAPQIIRADKLSGELPQPRTAVT